MVTGRRKIEAAFSPAGTPDVPAVICYEGIFIRDHWSQLTACPWWYAHSPDIDHQLAWRRDVAETIGQDWFQVPPFYAAVDQQDLVLEVLGDRALLINRRTGKEEELMPPQIGGAGKTLQEPIHIERLPTTLDEVDASFPEPPAADALAEDSADLAIRVLQDFGCNRFPMGYVASPLWRCYGLWGFEGMMTLISDRPDLVAHAAQRFLHPALMQVRRARNLGALGVWIEECFTDMIRPDAFAALNGPVLREILAAIRNAGLKSVYYYCGNPAGKWDHILDLAPDALALEETKKNFSIDIEEVAERVQGRCTLLGNLDAVGILQDGTDEQLRQEVRRQVRAGQTNRGRFIMSLGSPVTPGTPVDRVRRYCEMVHSK